MKESEITALAREYAEETVSHTRLSTTVADDTEDVIRFLLRRYCLVEKEAVRKEYKDARRDAREGYRAKLSTMIAVSEARNALLESLFPEIAKEVES